MKCARENVMARCKGGRERSTYTHSAAQKDAKKKKSETRFRSEMPSIPPQAPADPSLLEQLRAYINSLTKTSHMQQIAVGSGSGM